MVVLNFGIIRKICCNAEVIKNHTRNNYSIIAFLFPDINNPLKPAERT